MTTQSFPSPTIGRTRPLGLSGVGTITAFAGLSLVEYGENLPIRMTEFTLNACAFAISNAVAANQFTSQQIYTFPQGKILCLGTVSALTETTTTAPASTLNSNAGALTYGLGTAAASNVTLATTMINFLAGTGQTVPTITPSSAINTATALFTHHTLAAPIPIDGSVTPNPLFLNFAVPVDGDLDGDCTFTISGTIIVMWCNLGGYAY
jgi:hypothetical protein